MIPQVQSRTGKHGRCFEACLASILDLKEHEVPDFGDEPEFLRNVNAWLEQFGLYYIQAPLKLRPNGYHTIEGLSPRGGMHAVVGLNGVMVFDPHPQDGTRHGLVKEVCYGVLGAALKGK